MMRVGFVWTISLSMSIAPTLAIGADTNPTATWTFEEASGTTTFARIVSPPNVDFFATGTIEAIGPSRSPSQSGKGLEFHGNPGESLTLPDDAMGYSTLGLDPVGSLSFDVKFDSIGEEQVIFAGDSIQVAGRYMLLRLDPSGRLSMVWRDSTRINSKEAVSIETLRAGEWYHVLVRSSRHRALDVDLDGKPLTFTGFASSTRWFPAVLGSGVTYHVGRSIASDHPGVLDGIIDNVSFGVDPRALLAPKSDTVTVAPVVYPELSLTGEVLKGKFEYSVRVVWKSSNADYCDAFGYWQKGNVGKSGVRSGPISGPQTYTILCGSAFGKVSKTVTLDLPPPPPVEEEEATTSEATEIPSIDVPEAVIPALLEQPSPSLIPSKSPGIPLSIEQMRYLYDKNARVAHLFWKTTVPAATEIGYEPSERPESRMTVSVTEFPDTDHDVLVPAPPGEITVFQVVAKGADGKVDAKEYRIMPSTEFSGATVFDLIGVDFAASTFRRMDMMPASPTPTVPIENGGRNGKPGIGGTDAPSVVSASRADDPNEALSPIEELASGPLAYLIELLGFASALLVAIMIPMRSMVASDILLSFVRAMELMLPAKKKGRSWGRVLDARTSMPIDPVSVSVLAAESGSSIASVIANEEGKYGFALADGDYLVTVKKTGFVPPKSLADLGQDAYDGGIIRVRGGLVEGRHDLYLISSDERYYSPDEMRRRVEGVSSMKRLAIGASLPIYGFGLAFSVLAAYLTYTFASFVVIALYLAIGALLYSLWSAGRSREDDLALS